MTRAGTRQLLMALTNTRARAQLSLASKVSSEEAERLRRGTGSGSGIMSNNLQLDNLFNQFMWFINSNKVEF